MTYFNCICNQGFSWFGFTIRISILKIITIFNKPLIIYMMTYRFSWCFKKILKVINKICIVPRLFDWLLFYMKCMFIFSLNTYSKNRVRHFQFRCCKGLYSVISDFYLKRDVRDPLLILVGLYCKLTSLGRSPARKSYFE